MLDTCKRQYINVQTYINMSVCHRNSTETGTSGTALEHHRTLWTTDDFKHGTCRLDRWHNTVDIMETQKMDWHR